ncbi:aspartate--tRNA ligase [Blattabacterium cuenoti]|uniref:aspartate--tRNA ligase n=1 Tax=Blattabacterium cuenoti TaxID=1653831 RepID=UPI00163C18A4|nr:aspartate--tRNA ligase [Blattabacterium cuenoti]
MYRTHNCGELSEKDINKKIILSGWIKKIRNLGNIIFIDIRDYFGITQLVINKSLIRNNLGKEFLIRINGKVVSRSSKNNILSTGSIEVLVSKIEILNKSLIPPFIIEDKTDGTDKDRMIYRYLDIRRSIIKNNLIFRHKIMLEIRRFLSSKDFIEIETPILVNYTPEGARSFLVPSRNYQNKFYALHQSPQIFKQLLMIGGIDKYFQIIKCFRDEDARYDRQIEFTQIDCEMLFVDVIDILKFFEKFVIHIFTKFSNFKITKPFVSIPYYKSIKYYGTDCPDIRFGMKFNELNLLVNKENISILKKYELVIGIKIESFNYFPIDFKKNKIENKNIFCIKHKSEKKFLLYNKKILNYDEINIFSKFFNTNPGDFIFISYGKKNESRFLLKKIRNEIINNLSKKNDFTFNPIWITELPILKLDSNNNYKSVHHPFTSPINEDIHLLKKNPENVRSKSYDLVINGVEVASGSIRINKKSIQKLIFNHLGFSNKEIQQKFGFFIKALEYGTPPHGGIAFGLDRLISLLKKDDNIKNFIAFPKNSSGKDIMTNAPS